MDGKSIDQDPMQMPSWSIGMACVWIVTRSPTSAGRLWNEGFETVLTTSDGEPNTAIQDARVILINALISGAITSSGRCANGSRAAIPALEWEDMALTYRLDDTDGLSHCATSATGIVYNDIRLPRLDILKLWPEKSRPEIAHTPVRRGPKTGVLNRVKKEMADRNDIDDLKVMTEETMAEIFKASRDTCRRARDEILSELVTGDNSDK